MSGPQRQDNDGGHQTSGGHLRENDRPQDSDPLRHECSVVLRADDALCILVTLTLFNDEWQEDKPTRAIRRKN